MVSCCSFTGPLTTGRPNHAGKEACALCPHPAWWYWNDTPKSLYPECLVLLRGCMDMPPDLILAFFFFCGICLWTCAGGQKLDTCTMCLSSIYFEMSQYCIWPASLSQFLSVYLVLMDTLYVAVSYKSTYCGSKKRDILCLHGNGNSVRWRPFWWLVKSLLLCNWTHQSPLWQAGSSAAGQEVALVLWIRFVFYCPLSAWVFQVENEVLRPQRVQFRFCVPAACLAHVICPDIIIIIIIIIVVIHVHCRKFCPPLCHPRM